jgi:hypothetical protein
MRVLKVLAIAASGIAAGVSSTAWADDSPADALRGPSVNERPKDSTLVERDFSGRIKRVETDPVLAGLERIKLSSEERAAADKIVNERNTILDGIVQDNIQLLVQLNGARQAGDNAGIRKYVGEAMVLLRPLTARGLLIDELKSVLPKDKHEELARMVSEYRAASIGERMQGDMGKPGQGRAQASAAEFLENFGQELKRSYERVIGTRTQDFEALVKSLSLTPEQDSKVRRIVVDLAQKTSGKPTQRQTAKAFMDVYKLLDAEQRKVLIERAAEQRGAAAGARESKTKSKRED